MSDAFFYIDRPAVPATQQTLIDPADLLTSAVLIDPAEINDDSYLFVSEIKDENGEIHGTVFYAPGQSFADVMGHSDEEEYRLAQEEKEEEDDKETFDSEEE